MNISETLNIVGSLTIKVKNLEDELVNEVKVKNKIMLSGRELVAKLFNHESKIEDMKRVTRICLGTDDTSGNVNDKDTGLSNYIGETLITKVEQSQVIDNSTEVPVPRIMLRLTGELTEENCNGELKEAGLFTEDDVMYNRVIFAPINKSNKFKLTLIWEITF